MRTIKADTKPEAELAVLVGAVLGVIEVDVEEFLHRIDGGAAFGFGEVVHGSCFRGGC